MNNSIHNSSDGPGRNGVRAPVMHAEPLLLWSDRILFLLCCVVIAARGQMNETFIANWRVNGPMPGPDIATGEVPAMLIFSSLIVTMVIVRVILHLACGGLNWRVTSLGIPFILIAAGSVVSVMAASNRNVALIQSVTLMANVVLAMLLVQLLDRPRRQWLLLCVIAATGVTLGYRCWEQVYHEQPFLEQAFARDPGKALAGQGIEPGSYAAKTFAARIASRDVSGFYALSNTAAAFLILSLSAHLAVMVWLWRHRSGNWAWLILLGMLAGVQLWALSVTRSKGGIASFGAAVILMMFLGWQGKRLWGHWRKVLVLAALVMAAEVAGLVGYGLTYQKLPTTSMWIRWQYWQASAGMIAETPLTGVGAGNYGMHYPYYMDPAAPEVISDPHCLPIALWSQWGVLGFVGLVWAVCAVAIRFSRSVRQEQLVISHRADIEAERRAWLLGLLCAIGVLCSRLAVSDLGSCSTTEEVISIIIISFVMPFVIWFLCFHVISRAVGAVGGGLARIGSCGVLIPACGAAGFLLQNSIDFSFFVPGAAASFFALLAAALANSHDRLKRPIITVRPGMAANLMIGVAGFAIVLLLWVFVTLPVGRGYKLLKTAEYYALAAVNPNDVMGRDERIGGPVEPEQDYQKALSAADRSARLNRLDPEPYFLMGRMCFHRWLRSTHPTETLFLQGQWYVKRAACRDTSNYRYDRQLSEMYQYALLNRPDDMECVDKALWHLERVLERYPGKSEFLISYADLLGRRQRYPEAIEALEKVLRIERDFSQMQAAMYPELSKPIPRLTAGQLEQVRAKIMAFEKKNKDNQH